MFARGNLIVPIVLDLDLLLSPKGREDPENQWLDARLAESTFNL